jgi:hypothetical protein
MRTNYSRIKGIATATLLLVFFILNPCRTYSQGREGKGADEIDKAVWTMQAASVARELGLKKKKQDKLTRAYLGLREDISVKGKEKLKELEGEERQTEADAIARNCLGKFNSDLTGLLKPEQASRASFLLGSLNKRWEQYLELLLGFSLEGEAMQNASDAVYMYVDEYLTERKKASDANTRFSGQIATGLKEGLDGRIAEVLTEDQYKTWSETTAFKRKGK